MAYKDPEQQRRYKIEYAQRNREKISDYQREYSRRNRDRLRAQKAQYYEKNHETIKQRSRDHHSSNRERSLQVQRAWREANPGYQAEWYRRNREQIRIRGYAKRHGISPEDLTALWATQDGRCYLCGDEMGLARADLDHNHSCCPNGKSCQICRRGLACRNCNSAIGLANDDPERLRQMADALEAANVAVSKRKAASLEQTPF